MNRRRRDVHALSRDGFLSTSRAAMEWTQGRRHPLLGILLDFSMSFRHQRSKLSRRRLGATEP